MNSNDNNNSNNNNGLAQSCLSMKQARIREYTVVKMGKNYFFYLQPYELLLFSLYINVCTFAVPNNNKNNRWKNSLLYM